MPPKNPSSPASRAKRLAVLGYGVAVYALFLPTFLYAIGFVANRIVPRSIDSGEIGPLGTALAVNLGMLGLFAVQHMVMARPAFKRRWTRIIPAAAERSTFVLATCAGLCLMYGQWRAMPSVVWHVESRSATMFLEALSLFGWALVLVATFLIDHFHLFGLKQVIHFAREKPEANPAFSVRSLYRYIRHPLYLGFFIAFWATPTMTAGHLLFAGGCTGFVLIAVRLEERDLKNAHSEYEDYAERVPMIVPRPGRRYAAGVEASTVK